MSKVDFFVNATYSSSTETTTPQQTGAGLSPACSDSEGLAIFTPGTYLGTFTIDPIDLPGAYYATKTKIPLQKRYPVRLLSLFQCNQQRAATRGTMGVERFRQTIYDRLFLTFIDYY